MWEKCLPPHSTHITLGRDPLVVQGSLELEEIPEGRGAPLTEVPRFTDEEAGPGDWGVAELGPRVPVWSLSCFTHITTLCFYFLNCT